MSAGTRRSAALACAASAFAALAAQAGPAQDYMLNCMGCHGTQAEGVPGKVPRLANVLSGFMRTPAGRNYILRAPGAANSALSDARLAAVLNWLAVTYDSTPAESKPAVEPAPFTAQEVALLRHRPWTSASR